jgi:hypothetical protein
VSCIWYQRKHHLPSRPNQELESRIVAVCDHLDDGTTEARNQLKGTRLAAARKHDIVSTDTFNAYVHNPHFIPKAGDLISGWNQLAPFFAKVWA